MDTREYVEAHDLDLEKRRADFKHKVAALRNLLKERKLDAIVLSYTRNFAWISGGGRNFINMVDSQGVGSIYIDKDQVAILTNEIEGHRLVNEEFMGLEIEVGLKEEPWYSEASPLEKAKKLCLGKAIGVDTDDDELENCISELRCELSPYEMSIYRELGMDCGKIIGDVAHQLRPAMTEWEMCGLLSKACWDKGITPVVLLVAVDERIDKIRHPLPTNKRLKNKAMMVLCGRRGGFVLSVTRMVYVTTTPGAKVPEELLKRHDAATYVDAVAIVKTVPGTTAATVFKAIQDAYAERGFDGEWKLHHQGGAAGYNNREWIATPSHVNVICGKNEAYAWNPSVTGTKSEDTVLITEDGEGNLVREILSETPNWPLIEHVVDGVKIMRPGILHLAF